MEAKRIHVKSLILNYIIGLIKADTENQFKDILLELSQKIHQL